jgi:hypothetical protein
MAGKRKPRVTIQQRKLLRALISGKSLTDAAKEAGYAFVQSASRTMKNVNIRGIMLAEMEAGGIGPKVLVEKIDEHLQALRKDGHPDYIVQHMTIDTALKILGLYAPTKTEAIVEVQPGRKGNLDMLKVFAELGKRADETKAVK